MSDVRNVARRIFLCRARKETRLHVARSWADLANRVLNGECDDGQTIAAIRSRRACKEPTA